MEKNFKQINIHADVYKDIEAISDELYLSKAQCVRMLVNEYKKYRMMMKINSANQKARQE